MRTNKHFLTIAKNRKQNSITIRTWLFQTKTLILFFTLSLAGCIKERTPKPAEDEADLARSEKQTEGPKAFCPGNGLSFQTLRELERVRAATARYSTIRNAFSDGYADMNLKM